MNLSFNRTKMVQKIMKTLTKKNAPMYFIESCKFFNLEQNIYELEFPRQQNNYSTNNTKD